MQFQKTFKAIFRVLGISLFIFICTTNTQAQSEIATIKSYLTNIVERKEKVTNKELMSLSATDINEMKVSSAYLSPSTGWFHAYFNQTYKGIEVYNALLNVALKDAQVAHTVNQFVPNVQLFQLSEKPTVKPIEAIQNAAQHVGQTTGTISELLKTQVPNVLTFQDPNLSNEPIEMQLYWLPVRETKKTNLRLVWNVRFQTKDDQNWWNIRVDAQNGAILEKNDWTTHCSLENHAIYEAQQTVLPIEKNALFLPSVAANSYNVFDIPLEAPSFGARTIASSPYTRFVPASTGPGATNGWHDDGTTAYTTTRGNNVHAQEDVDGSNGTIGASPTSATLEFDYAYSGSATTLANQNASITNLFYWNNLVHDVLYRYGFDEPSGNFQASNMGRGGAGADYVMADAQDGSGSNNANFSTPNDGAKGRMQMFLWSVPGASTFRVNSPAPIATIYPSVESTFSTNNKIGTLGSITGDLVLVNDASSTSLGCTTPFINAAALAGKVALIDRGTCNFVVKVKNCQNAGAIAVIVINNIAGAANTMGGSDNSITIPAFSISLADGTILKNNLASNINITMSGTLGSTLDASFDNGIVSHEYGHGWSTRLTGGPANSGCLSNAEQMGEGWSDYLALMLTTNWASLSPNIASANISRGIGTYAIGEPTTGRGIRPFPYSYDMAGVNPTVTYGQVGSSIFSDVHSIGSIWATMLWDMTWEIIMKDNAIVSDISNTATLQGNAAAFKLVNEGLRLQACSPSFIQGRDAILLADEMMFNGKYKCAIWKAFARRGLGVNASTGASSDDLTVTQDFTEPAGADVLTTVSPIAAAEGATVTYTVAAKCKCTTISNAAITAVLPTSMTYINGSASNSGGFSGNTVTWSGQNFAPLASQTYTFQAKVNTGTYSATTKPLNDNIDGSTPAGAWAATAITGSAQWTTSTAQSNSPTHALYAANTTTASDFVYKSGLSFNLVGPATLTFAHRFFTEADWDGGVVEISTNNGSTWQDLGAYMTSNGYNGSLGGFGRDGFTGDGQTWRTTTVNLEPFCGTTAQIRFRMMSDDNTDCGTSGACGWYVDDVVLNIPSGSNTIGNAATSAGNSSENACLQILQNSAVPIELISFEAAPSVKTIQLTWLIASERELAGFDIMKSSDNCKTFNKVAWVTRHDDKSYSIEDEAVQANIVYYYYLKSIDNDGKSQNSKVVSAKLELGKPSLSIFPNPVKNIVTLRSSKPIAQNMHLSVRNIDGRLMKSWEVGADILAQGFSMDCSELSAGLYFLEFQSAELSGVQKLTVIR